MKDSEIDLESVNWQRGMLLTPEHFLRQERYIDSLSSWVLRYATESYGLVGGGPRVERAERGAVGHDPKVTVTDDGLTVNVTVTQCRGISPSGDIVDVDPAHPVSENFDRRALEGKDGLVVYVVAGGHEKEVGSAQADEANPQLKSSRRQRYRLGLGNPEADAPRSVTLCRVRRGDGLRYEKVGDFIPVCTTMVGHSGLNHAWETVRDQLARLADRYALLHKAIVNYIGLASERHLNTREDEETLQFVGRMVVTLEGCAYEVLNPLQTPQRFFQHVYRAVRSAAVYLDVSPPTREYFRQLAGAGVSDFEALLEQEDQTLRGGRDLNVHDDLSEDVRRVGEALYRLRRLEEALEGKYVDFRMSTSLESLTFFFDSTLRDTPTLYQSVTRPSPPSKNLDELTFVFAQLRLEGHGYRLVLIGQPDERILPGTTLPADVRVNSRSGQASSTIFPRASCELYGQRNFAIDFEKPPGVHTITDLQVTIKSTWPIRSCMLYDRRLLQSPRSQTGNLRPHGQRLSQPQPQPPPQPTPQPTPPLQPTPPPQHGEQQPQQTRRRRLERSE